MIELWRFAWISKAKSHGGALSFWRNDQSNDVFFKICGRVYWRVTYVFDEGPTP